MTAARPEPAPGTAVGFAGLGTMGAAMAANLVRAGFQVHAWNRTPGRAAALLELGVDEAPDPAALAADAEIVVVCVSDTPDVEQVLFGDRGIAAGARPGTVVVDCSTISPSATRAFAARLAAGGVSLVDAPVTGGSEGARKGTLSILVGGAPDDVERVRPVLAAMGTTITRFGPVGSGQVAKAVNQVVIATGYLSVAEGLVLAMKAGLDPEQVVAALSGGVANSWILANRSGRMIRTTTRSGSRSRSTARTWRSRWPSPARPACRCRARRSSRPWRMASSPEGTARTISPRSPG